MPTYLYIYINKYICTRIYINNKKKRKTIFILAKLKKYHTRFDKFNLSTIGSLLFFSLFPFSFFHFPFSISFQYSIQQSIFIIHLFINYSPLTFHIIIEPIRKHKQLILPLIFSSSNLALKKQFESLESGYFTTQQR